MHCLKALRNSQLDSQIEGTLDDDFDFYKVSIFTLYLFIQYSL